MGVAAAIAGAAVVGGVATVAAGNKSANAIRDSAQQSNDTQERIFQQQRADNEPWRQVGTGALAKLAKMYGVGGTTAQDGANDNSTGYGDVGGFTASPGYQFRLEQGLKAIERSAAARGGLRSGATMKSLNDYAQGVASDEFGKYVSGLQSLAGVGQNANSQNAQAGQNFANQTSANTMNAGAARASSYANTGSAINQGVQNLASAYLYNKGFGTGGVTTTPAPSFYKA